MSKITIISSLKNNFKNNLKIVYFVNLADLSLRWLKRRFFFHSFEGTKDKSKLRWEAKHCIQLAHIFQNLLATAEHRLYQASGIQPLLLRFIIIFHSNCGSKIWPWVMARMHSENYSGLILREKSQKWELDWNQGFWFVSEICRFHPNYDFRHFSVYHCNEKTSISYQNES